MEPISKDEAITRLNPYFESFRRVFLSAWDHYMTKYEPARRLEHSKSARAQIIHDLIKKYAQEIFQDFPGVMFRQIRGLFVMEVFPGFLIKLKKLNTRGQPQNTTTRQTSLFNHQHPIQQEIPGIPRGRNLVLGYQLDKLQQNIQSCLMVCPNGRRIDWLYFINDDCTAGLAFEPIRPIINPVNSPDRRMVKPKVSPSRKRAEGKNAS